MSVLKSKVFYAVALVAVITLVFGLTGCSTADDDNTYYIVDATSPGGDLPEVGVDSMFLNETSLALDVGDTVRLAVRVRPANLRPGDITWRSSDATVARVTDSGTVIALLPGETQVSFTSADGKFSDTCEVIVSAPVTGVTIDKGATGQIVVRIGQTVPLTADVEPSYATVPDLIWTSRNDAIATVDPDGTVTGVAEGTVTIIVTTVENGFTDTVSVTVNIPVESVTIDRNAVTLTSGDWTTLVATVLPAHLYSDVIWETSDPNVVEVNDTGRVYARFPGDAVITVRSADDPSKFAVCAVTVERYPDNNFRVSDSDDWNRAIGAIRFGDRYYHYTVTIIRGFVLSEVMYDSFDDVSVNVTFTGNQTVTSGVAGTLLKIGFGQTVNLVDIDLRGNPDAENKDHPLISVSGGGKLNMSGTATIAGHGGAGVQVNADSEFSMDNNTSVSNNLNRGVDVNGGSFTMDGTSHMQGNSVEGSGGAVIVRNGGEFVMNVNVLLHNNTTSGDYNDGGAVFVVGDGSRFYLNGGGLHDNGTTGNGANGGAVAVRNGGLFEMNYGGSIYSNYAAAYGHGGGVYVGQGATFRLNNGLIYDNKLNGVNNSDGAGVAVDGTFEMRGYDSRIYKNIAGDAKREDGATVNNNYGGGVSVRHSGFFLMEDGIISANSAYYGGGVYVYGRFHMTGGVIFGTPAREETDFGDLDTLQYPNLAYFNAGGALYVANSSNGSTYGANGTITGGNIVDWNTSNPGKGGDDATIWVTGNGEIRKANWVMSDPDALPDPKPGYWDWLGVVPGEDCPQYAGQYGQCPSAP